MAGEFLRFGMVGTVGFVVDAGVLEVARAGLGPWLGRLVSYVAAASVTFALNRAWTFRYRDANALQPGVETSGQGTLETVQQEVGRQWALFLAVNLVGFAFNYGTYAALIAGVPVVARNPVLGVAAGSLAGMAGNFLLSRRFVFGRGPTPRPATPRPLAGT